MMEGKLIKTKTGFYLWRNPLNKSQEILGATVLIMNDNGVDLREYKLSLKNCQAIENGYDLDELANEWVFETNGHKWSNNDNTAGDNYSSFKEGFQKAIEILGNKKFSEDDIKRAVLKARIRDKDNPPHPLYSIKSIVKSLQQTEWDVSFNPDEKDADGCLILKRKV